MCFKYWCINCNIKHFLGFLHHVRVVTMATTNTVMTLIEDNYDLLHLILFFSVI
jgi:hypothetical protein